MRNREPGARAAAQRRPWTAARTSRPRRVNSWWRLAWPAPGAYFFIAAAPPCWFSGLFVSVPPAMRSQVPLGTAIQASLSRSAVAVPAHALLLVPQSFLPALTMPAHFSVSPFAASARLLAAPRLTARRLATVPRRRGVVGLMAYLQGCGTLGKGRGACCPAL